MRRYETVSFAFVAALTVALALTPLARRIALRYDLVDHPSNRKLHADPVPNLGGAAVVLAFVCSMVALEVLGRLTPAGRAGWTILLGGMMMAAIGFWDDRRVLPGWIKVPAVLLLGLILFFANVRADLLIPWPLDLILTMGWVIGITNAINYMDNMDGLGPGIAAITAGYFAVLAGVSGQVLVAVTAAALAGSSLGFLWFNRPPARIFLGDSGSLFLGFVLAALGLELRFHELLSASFLVPIVVLTLPILDALMVSVSRVRRGLSPLHPGKDHISHRLVAEGISPGRTVGLLLLAAAIYGVVATLMATSAPGFAYLMAALVCLTGLGLGASLLRTEP
ncbi:MAG: glycosyltransferase family 4 protein [Actinomycetota bacterium]